MRIGTEHSDEAVLAELGSRLRRARLERNLSQSQLAEEAGVSRLTIANIEEGKPSQLLTLIRVLRVLGLSEWLDRLAPKPAPSPMERLQRRGRERQRASSPRSSREAPRPWSWGVDRDGNEDDGR